MSSRKPIVPQIEAVERTSGQLLVDAAKLDRGRASLEHRERWLRIVIEGAPIVLWALDRDGIITLSEGKALETLGYRSGELVGHDVFEMYKDNEEAISNIKRALAGEAFSAVVDIGDLCFENTYSPIYDHAGNLDGAIAVSTNITERKNAERRLKHLAYHDELTGLPNRSLFQDSASLAIARARRRGQAVALLYLDLDRFKLVNDSFGHSAGDELLRVMAKRLRGVIRGEDAVARHSGDEFLLLLADLDVVEPDAVEGSRTGALHVAEVVAAKIHKKLCEPVLIEGHEVSIDTSIGISLYPRDAPDPDALLGHADIAMYEAKRTGRGGTEVYARTSHDSTARLSTAGQLRGALDRDEFVLHYQPIVRMAGGKVDAVEALIRWQRSDGTLLYPADFIFVAEEIGMLQSIDDWVVHEASRRWSAWKQSGVCLPIAVNLSSIQFRRTDLADVLLSQIADAGGDPEGIVVEITEAAAMADVDLTKDILERLRAAKVQVAIDDFGSGYSSLGRLADLQVQTLKMDASFIRHVPDADAASVMVAGIVQIAHRMGVRSLAEGIETDAQRRFLIESGCELGQGYYFSKPLPAHEVEPLLSAHL